MDDLYIDALASRFDPALRKTPYADENEYIRDVMSVISLYLLGAVACKAACAEEVQVSTGYLNLPHTAMTIEEAECYAGEFPQSAMQPDAELSALCRGAQSHIDSRLAATKLSGLTLHLERLRDLFELSDFSFFCVCCALSVALDRGFERMVVALHGDTEQPFLTLGAARACYGLANTCEPDHWQRLLNPCSPECRLLFAPSDDPPLLRTLALRPAVLGYILHEPYMSRALSACCELIDCSAAHDDALFIDSQIRRVSEELARMRRREEPRLCILSGGEGAGKRLTLTTASGESDLLLLRSDDARDLSDATLDELVTSALLWDRVLCIYCNEPSFRNILAAVRPYRLGVMLLTNQLRASVDGYLVTQIDYPALTLAQSLDIWRLYAAKYPVAPDVDLSSLAAKYTLTPGKIKTALRTASEIADGTPVSAALIDAAILQGNTGRLCEIADKIQVFYKWDDLVLSETSKQMLRDVCDRIKYRHLVETRWGFGGKSAYGTGTSILLYGPPGTGKTMSAQVVAGELGLPLYRINLAQIISKYIGETAKNLDAVFSEAKSSNVILFFDEADALFAKRTDVKNSNDRHANSESSYLLQKIEEYSGISILATNLANNFDEAFRRRIGYMINIHMPSPAQRLELWRSVIPDEAPVSPDLDLRLLAENLEFSGSVIKSAVIQAAYFAARDDAPISMTHLARAVRRELAKLSKSEPHFLSLYPD